MLKLKKIYSLLAVLLLLTAMVAQAAEDAPAQAARHFFQAVGSKDYATAWGLLTKSSQDSLIDSMAKSEKMDPTAVRNLFDRNDSTIQSGFWDSFRKSSVADQIALKNFASVSQDGNQAKVQVDGKLGLLMFNEGGWKFGFQETFFPNGMSGAVDKG